METPGERATPLPEQGVENILFRLWTRGGQRKWGLFPVHNCASHSSPRTSHSLRFITAR